MRQRYRSVDLRQLRSFVTIADAAGFGRAAVRLHLSQPALSRQIRALESELGVQLFDRIGRRIQLTSEGEDLLRRSRNLLREADSLGERARALKGGQSGVLRVGATPQLIESLLAVFLMHYRRRHPGVEVHLAEDGGASLPGRLERGEVHLTLTVVGDDRFRARVLFPVYCLAVLSPSHRLGRRRRATLEFAELADEPVLILRRGFGSREWFEAACRIADVRPRVLLESGAPHALLALARVGYGIAVVPSAVQVDRAVRAVPLVQNGAPIGGWMMAAWDPRRFLAPYAEQFVEELAGQCRRTYPGRDVTRRAPPLPRPKERPAVS